MAKISASLLAADFSNLSADVLRAQFAGVDAFHFDMMDGHYVPNIDLSPQHLTALRQYSNLPFHLHLELGNPDNVLDHFPQLDADVIFVQMDTLVDPLKTFARIRSRGAKAGLSFNPGDDLMARQSCIQYLDYFLLLSIHPGFGGQSMLDGTLERILTAKKLIHAVKPDIPLMVDGGVTLDNALPLLQAGVDWLIIGNDIFKQQNMDEYIQKIKAL
ncbi:MAG TPA: ribulose-phosphate 3-epimerase [Longilinea sp.]|nr:ribulose-phosphate 3-epimerase [Longilinea sp.]